MTDGKVTIGSFDRGCKVLVLVETSSNSSPKNDLKMNGNERTVAENQLFNDEGKISLSRPPTLGQVHLKPVEGPVKILAAVCSRVSLSQNIEAQSALCIRVLHISMSFVNTSAA